MVLRGEGRRRREEEEEEEEHGNNIRHQRQPRLTLTLMPSP
jgi:hypothetical protein